MGNISTQKGQHVPKVIDSSMMVPFLFFTAFFSLAGAITAKSCAIRNSVTTTSNHVKHQKVVSCWDNCLDESTLASVLAAGQARSHGFTSIFDRWADNFAPRSPLESAIASDPMIVVSS